MLRIFNRIKTLVSDAAAFARAWLYIPPKNTNALLITCPNPNLYHRFFYLLVKMYKLSGYSIYYPMDFAKFRNLRNKDRYLGLMVREKHFLSIRKKNMPDHVVELTQDMLSPDYFKSYFALKNREENVFHVPMSFHPFMYHKGLWSQEIDTGKKRLNAVFCYGNFDPKAYLAIKKTTFSVATRIDLLNFFRKQKSFVSITGKKDITDSGDFLDRKYVFAIKDQYQIPMEEVRELLSYFNFYLCCPGVVMPLCHNVIEAMSVGTIPLIQKEYAEVMYPHLKHGINAVIFEHLDHLKAILADEIFNYSENEISSMKRHVLDYYNDYLSPEAVVKNVNKSIQNDQLIYLQAEHRSVKFRP
ncbi:MULTISPECIES: hypothetical protein [Chryseobacterium]|uniref:Glycosyltransferase family 1 protein n=1 Tax=Chryseobacterium camelliae TaxID=1265445 RepID=A0ABU0TNA5_9FLAO|nr:MULTISPECIES: hypothetical protein [Chryseobacterium]MDT3407623.1 hypothetical protein [Pseudacidovorax intermedius]MDQ1098524.1 hypothetical protein [Chryseobacterium camelliae]MDQ1102449.1 hypothetical protein [Chryseobacterium sp. SORGH_AS_1048]MDR6085882.1 hypothetical protein [Chryseobacterium sp. SORGH_AS_0909]MDR6130249.1 hypothetical protein [Chryseobacterium sp. SORGH_AS_1175]